MNKSDREVIAAMLKESVPIDRIERLVAIVSLVVIDIYAMSQGINNGLTITISGIIGGIAGYSLHLRRNSAKK